MEEGMIKRLIGTGRGGTARRPTLLLGGLCVLALCRAGVSPSSEYVPAVVFEGYIEPPGGGATWTRLPGNEDAPNRCTLVGDTIRIYCYSEDYYAPDDYRSGTGYGDQLRIDLYPFGYVDSITLVSLRNVLIKLSRFGKPANETYLVTDADTLYSPPFQAQMSTSLVQRYPGGAVELREFNATLHRVNGTTPAVTISRATITGRIQH
jgi:hypothetical protein